jgi:glycolate oxidase subunit GlcD
MNAPPRVLGNLQAVFGARLKVREHERLLYGYDATGESALPDAVVHVSSAEEIGLLLQAAREAGIPIVPRGTGTGLSGGSVPLSGGIVATFEDMRRVLAVDAAARRVWVEPGVINNALDAVLAPFGLFFPPDPASHRVSTLGGNIAENAGGPRAVKYGVTGHHVVRLRVADACGAAGTLVAGELQPSFDLVALVVGSEGTLAVVTAAQLTVEHRPSHLATILLSFADMLKATTFVSAVIERCIVPATLEFLDRKTIEALEAWGVTRYPDGVEAVLLLELDGAAADVAAESGVVKALAADMGAIEVRHTDDPAERDELWRGRRGSYAAMARYGKRMLTEDVTVPRERLTEMLAAVERIAERYHLLVATLGHAGDGNLHPGFPYDPDDPDMTRRVHEANTEVLQACVAMGGSISGEHGIGSDKLPLLDLMYDPAELGLMADVKRALDPSLILNPGKAVTMAPREAPAGVGAPCPRPRRSEDVQLAILDARSSRSQLQVDLSDCTGIAVDARNLTVEIGAGERWRALHDALASTSLRFPVRPLREQRVYEALLLNDYGPEHVAYGTLRRSLLAATLVTGAGEVVRLGRAVIKNVAGYDLYRLLIGSRGYLGVPVTCTFRLVVRKPRSWARRLWEEGASIIPPSAPQPGALLALRDGGRLMLYGSFQADVPAGWSKAPNPEPELRRTIQALDSRQDVLDLATEPSALARVLAVAPAPAVVLPAAARALIATDRATAIGLTETAGQDASVPFRSLWGPAREPLHRADPLAADWEAKLRAVFDPDRILSGWLAAARGQN